MLVSLTLVAGLVLLALGGELLVRGATRLAGRFGVPPLVVGLTVVAFGTSAPELAVSLQSVSAGAASLAVGNVVGSNIFNVLFILGGAALIAPLTVSRRVIWIEVPIMIAVSALAWLLASDGGVTIGNGVALLLVIGGYLGWMLRTAAGDQSASADDRAPERRSALGSVLTVVAGLALLVLGARWLVQAAVSIAQALGVNDVVVGLTIVAAGTSLPEVAASLVATARGQTDIAVGNVLGSNIFNLTMILGTTAIAGGGLAVAPGVVSFDLIVMVAVAVACLPIFATGHTISRWEGGLFLAYYAAYAAYLVLDATEHENFPRVRDALLYALPLTAVTLLVVAARAALTRAPRGR